MVPTVVVGSVVDDPSWRFTMNVTPPGGSNACVDWKMIGHPDGLHNDWRVSAGKSSKLIMIGSSHGPTTMPPEGETEGVGVTDPAVSS